MSLNRLLRASLAAAWLCCSSIAPVAVFAQPAASAPAEAVASEAAAAPPPAPLAPVVAKDTIENPYGLDALWKQGDFVARGTLVIMVIMSIGSWYIIFTKVFEQSRLIRAGRAVGEAFWKAGSVAKGAQTLHESSAFRYIAEEGVKATEHHEGSLVEHIDRHTWIGMSVQRSVDNINSRLQDGLAFLTTVGSTAPFVGLFGTVWGIYHALTAIGIAGQASIDKVAGPVGEALIMTAFGLVVAIPAVLAYNAFTRANRMVLSQLDGFAHALHAFLTMGARVPSVS